MQSTLPRPTSPWKTLANLCFALAFCLSGALLVALANFSHNPRQIDITFELLLLPFWLSMMFALAVTTARCGFDWVAKSRGLQYVWVLSACVALVVVSWFVYNGWNEPSIEHLWALRPLLAVAIVLPLTSVIGGVLALNPALSARLPTWLSRAPSMVAGGLSLLAFAAIIIAGRV